MLENKYNMTQEENVFLAKRNIVDSMWKSANLEGIAITFPETQAIYDGCNVAHLRIDEIQTVNNLKHAWQFILSSIKNDIDFNYISSVHSLVGANIVDSAGTLRKFDVSMGGTNWKPVLPSIEKLNNILEEYKNSRFSNTDAIINLMCKLMKMQAFNDGNKRTAMLIANHELIKNGKGIISISEENKIEFGKRLIEYYEDEHKLNDLKIFIFEKCLDGIEK
ncbi:MAG: Fic family protein [Clostridia bacterium]|nr:Fic family protein [Clostridia bacterium]